MTKRHTLIATSLITLALLGGCFVTKCSGPSEKEVVDAGKQCLEEKKQVEANLRNFDDLDYNVFTNQKWMELHRSHAQNIKVYWPDGHHTEGIEKHIDDLSAMFSWAPDTRIKTHPVRIGQGEWTAVIGEMQGTFTQPMQMPDGSVLQPTGNAYNIRMVTMGHWKDGVMDEEHFFWDNKDFMRQIGVVAPY